MILIHSAFHSEAKAFIEHYELKLLHELDNFNVFRSADHLLIVSGLGKVNTAVAIGYLSAKFPSISHYFNIGICGANDKFQIGELVVPNKIVDLSTKKTFYPELQLKVDFKEGILGTSLTPVIKEIDDIDFYDMEAASFFEAASKFQSSSRIHTLKVISDNLVFENIKKEVIEKLIGARVIEIARYMDSICSYSVNKKHDLSDDEIDSLSCFSEKHRLTVSQKNSMFQKALGFKVRGGNVESISKIKAKCINSNKKDRNELFREVEKLFSS